MFYGLKQVAYRRHIDNFEKPGISYRTWNTRGKTNQRQGRTKTAIGYIYEMTQRRLNMFIIAPAPVRLLTNRKEN